MRSTPLPQGAVPADPEEPPGSVQRWSEVDAVVEDAPAGGPSPLIGVVVGGVVVVLLLVFGHTLAAGVLLALLIGLFIAGQLVPAVPGALARVMGRFGVAVGHLLRWALLGGVELVVFTPIWLLTRLLRWNMIGDATGAEGRWQPHVRRAYESLPHRSFAREHRFSWTRRLHAGAVLAFLAGALLLAFPFRSFSTEVIDSVLGSGDGATQAPSTETTLLADGEWQLSGQGPREPPHDPLVAESADWAPGLVEEVQAGESMGFTFDPHTVVRMAPSESEHVNVADRVRRTYTPADLDPSLDVWFFGSSALFGLSIIRDDHTIPSELVRLAEADGISINASNFAVSGFLTWQAATLMAQMLTERPDPDLVVFYGGYNDLATYMAPDGPTEVSSSFAADVLTALGAAGATHIDTEDITPRNDGWSPGNAATLYDRSIEYAEGIVGSRGIPFANFLQPSLWTRDRPENDVTIESVGADRTFHDSYGAIYNAARTTITADVIDLADVLDDVPGVLFWDFVHNNELANRAIAEAMYVELTAQLTDLWSANAG